MTELRRTVEEAIELIDTEDFRLSFSSFKNFMRTPKSFIRYLTEKKSPSPAMIQGKLNHLLALQPELFEEQYVLEPEGINKRTNVGKAEMKQFLEENAGKTVISKDQFETAQRAINNLYNNYESRWHLNKLTQVERLVEWEMFDLKWRGYIDGEGDDRRIELKFTSDADPGNFQRNALYYFYWLQGVFYSFAEGDDRPFYIIAVDPMGDVSVHELTAFFKKWGFNEWSYYAMKYIECKNVNAWFSSFEYWKDKGKYEFTKPVYYQIR